MRRRTWELLGLGILVAGIAAAGPADESKQDLAAEVQALRKQVQALEKRLKTLESASSSVITLPAPNRDPDYLPAPGGPADAWRIESPTRDLPPGSVRKEFNGSSYYVIPIGETGGSPAKPAVLAPAAAAD